MWHNVRFLNAISNICMTVFLMAVIVGMVGWIIQKPVYALRIVRIQSTDGKELQHVNALTVRNVALPRIKGNFFTVDLDEVRSAFESVPWIRKASVRREWPGGLIISVEEYQPLGTWGNEGRLLSTKGELFTVNMAEAEEDYDLRAFSGPEGSEKEVLAHYGEFCRQFAQIHLVPRAVHLSSRYAWSIRLDNGMRVEFGREKNRDTINDLMKRLKDVYPQLQAKLGDNIENIDMRYPNGLALRVKGKQPVSGT